MRGLWRVVELAHGLRNARNKAIKRQRNADYLEKLEQSFRQLENGEVVHKSLEELRAMEQ